MKLFRAIEAVADGNYTVGDVMDFTLNDGEEVQALAVKQEDDGMLFVLLDCLADKERMNEECSNCGGFISSVLCAKLNGAILDRFPAEIRKKMVAFSNGLTLRLPTEKEIFGKNVYGKDEGDAVQRWKLMKQRRWRVAFPSKNDDWEWYWLANQVDGSASDFAHVSIGGYANYGSASVAGGVRPVFKYGGAEDYVPENKRLYALKKDCIECESLDCCYNHNGECRLSMVHERKPHITEDSGCSDYNFKE